MDGESGAAEFGQDFLCQFLEAGREVADLLFAFLGVGVQGEHAENDVLVLDVGSLHQFLEALPVLGRVPLVDLGVELCLLQLLVHVVARRFLSFFGEGRVHLDGAFRRGVGRHFDVVQHEALLVRLDVAERLHELLHGGRGEFARADVGLVDEVFDLRLLRLLDGILVGVGRHGRVGRAHRAAHEFGGGQHAVGHLHGRHLHHLLAHAGLEREVEFALLHGGHIVEVVLHRVVAAQLVGDFLVVALHLLALEGSALAHGLAPGMADFGHNGHDGLLLHVLFGEAAVDGQSHLAARSLHRRGGYGEVVGGEFAQLAARGQHQRAAHCQREKEFALHGVIENVCLRVAKVVIRPRKYQGAPVLSAVGGPLLRFF